jgi:D-alanyl-D-alanine carboxypeptidase
LAGLPQILVLDIAGACLYSYVTREFAAVLNSGEATLSIASEKSGRWFHRLRGRVAATAFAAFALVAGVAHAGGYGAIVIDATTGKVVESVNPNDQIHPASLTKMMTLYLAFQALQNGKLKIDQQLPVSSWAANKSPTKLGLRNGETVSVEDCILGMVTKSANDAATVMAEGLGGSEAHFAQMMTAQARLLGMTDTYFNNASGLPDPDQLTTASDMVKLAMALYRDFPQDSHYFATKEFVFRGQIVHGHNHLMDRYPGMDGLKTGFTDASGFNLASTAVRDGHRLFGVVLGSRTAAGRDQLMARLLDDGFANQQTPATLVAQAAGVRENAALKVLAALSPIATAQADTLPATRSLPRRVRHGSRSAPVVLARQDRRRGKAAPAVLARRGSASRAAAASTCPRRGAHSRSSCPPPHRSTGGSKLAYRSGNKKAPKLAQL